MASVYKRGKILWISAYDKIKKRRMAKSTRLVDTAINRKLVKKKAEELQKMLDENAKQYQESDFRDNTIRQAFEHHLNINRGKHPKTIMDYQRFYKKFTEAFDESEECSVITKKSVENWLIDMKDDGINILSYYRQLSNFLSTLFEYDYIPQFIINRSIRPTPPKKEKIVFTPEHLKMIFHNLKNESEALNTMVHLAFYTGLRASDIVSIKEVDLKNRTISYYSPKRKQTRRVAFHEKLLPILKKRLESDISGTVVGYKHYDSMSKAFTKYLRKIGLGEYGYSSRTFRKTFQTLALYFQMDVAVTDELVGYESSKTSLKYYVNISIPVQRRELKKYKMPDENDNY